MTKKIKCTTPKCKQVFMGMQGKEDTYPKCLKELITPNKYHKELKQAVALLARIAEESGQYGEDKQAELKAVELLETFISNRI